MTTFGFGLVMLQVLTGLPGLGSWDDGLDTMDWQRLARKSSLGVVRNVERSARPQQAIA